MKWKRVNNKMKHTIEPIIVNNRKIYPFKTKDELIKYIVDYKGLLIAIGVEKLLTDDSKLIEIFNNNITYSDGYGAVYALKRKGVEVEKIPGAYLWLDIVKEFSDKKTFYLIGAKNEIYNQTIHKLKLEFPHINIVGGCDGYFKSDELLISDIKKHKPDIVLTALGSPKQEFFMNKASKEYQALYMGLGGSFDLYVGDAKPVPEWWNKYIKWEGLYRMFMDIKNVKRLKRQFILFKFIQSIISGKI